MNVVCVGDLGVDRYLPLKLDRPGGIALNFVAHARRLFDPSDRITLVSALGTDEEAVIARRGIETLDVRACITEIAGRTSLQLIDLEPSGEKIFVEYHQGILGEFRIGAPEQELISDADLLFAPYYEQIDGFFASIVETPSRGIRAVDFADIADRPTTERVEEYGPGFSIAFFGLSSSHRALIDALETVARRQNKLFIVTLGAEGSLALTGGGRLRVPAVSVDQVVDTTGAGDTFAAGFLSEYCRSKGVTRALRRGAEEAARTITHIGAF
ncbi:MAG TPA: PfkB family carbohydrate kinase [Vicinamibacteria bacterium]|nr:PfkB family carbohydrate kinase [Vicinamibacteria bacterium]